MGTQFCRCLCALSVVTLGVIPTQSCFARTWQDASRTFSVQATYVGISRGQVKLKRSDSGKTITIPFKKLSDADQRFVRREYSKTHGSRKTANSTSRKSTPGKSTKSSVRVKASRLKSYGEEPKEPQLVRMNLEMKGKAANEALSYTVTVDSIEAKDNTLVLANGSEISIGKEQSVDRDGNEAIKPGLDVLLEFMPVKKGLRRIDAVSGKIRLKTGGDILQTKISSFSNGAVSHPNLVAHGVNVDLKVKDGKLSVESTPKPDWIRLTDARGNPHPAVMGWGNMSNGKTQTVEFDFENQEIPQDIELRIQTRTGSMEQEFPFSAKRLTIKELEPFDTF